ncbi:MAG: hypothetical protein H7145_25140 [Akkermansiaceae bacterium]|nr:hypothetical protein [Armatimonadota bacterium]
MREFLLLIYQVFHGANDLRYGVVKGTNTRSRKVPFTDDFFAMTFAQNSTS